MLKNPAHGEEIKIRIVPLKTFSCFRSYVLQKEVFASLYFVQNVSRMKNLYCLLLFLLPACQADGPDEPIPDTRPELVRAVETAHRKNDCWSREIVSFDLELNWRGQPSWRANVTQRTDGTRIRIKKSDGSDMLFDGETNWLAGTESDADARFDLYAWHYFFCLPWKLTDPGAACQPLPDRVLEGAVCSTARLSFAPGTGDTPDDWFLIFSDKKEGLLRGALYVVTFGGKTPEAAGKEPQAIFYSDYRLADGIPVAHAWKFYRWHTDGLEEKEELGDAVIRNVRFAKEAPDDFTVPAGARKM